MALVRSRGDYKAEVCLDEHARNMIAWWMTNLHSKRKPLRSSPPTAELQTDASLTGWRAKLGTVVTGGHWDVVELDHITCLELKAVLLGLKSLCKDFSNTHIRLR